MIVRVDVLYVYATQWTNHYMIWPHIGAWRVRQKYTHFPKDGNIACVRKHILTSLWRGRVRHHHVLTYFRRWLERFGTSGEHTATAAAAAAHHVHLPDVRGGCVSEIHLYLTDCALHTHAYG